jgi:TPR repeat protein
VQKVVTAGERRSQLNAAKLVPPAESSGWVGGGTAVKAALHPPGAEAVAPKIVAAVQTVRREPGQSELETETLVSRGDALLGIGDLTAARLFYRRGADLGDSTAALRLGETFDPAFLQQAGLGRIAGDVKSALYWYQWAHALGNGDADLLTKGLIPIGSNKQ